MKVKMTTEIGTFEFEGDNEAVQMQVSNLITSISAVGKEYNHFADNPRHRTARANKKQIALQPKNLSSLLSVEDINHLKGYMAEKKPISHLERCLVFTLWLREQKNIPSVSQDEMWTLYLATHTKPPMNLVQIFRDGKSKRGFFDSAQDEPGRYLLTSVGETYIKFDLPKKEEGDNDK